MIINIMVIFQQSSCNRGNIMTKIKATDTSKYIFDYLCGSHDRNDLYERNLLDTINQTIQNIAWPSQMSISRLLGNPYNFSKIDYKIDTNQIYLHGIRLPTFTKFPYRYSIYYWATEGIVCKSSGKLPLCVDEFVVFERKFAIYKNGQTTEFNPQVLKYADSREIIKKRLIEG